MVKVVIKGVVVVVGEGNEVIWYLRNFFNDGYLSVVF